MSTQMREQASKKKEKDSHTDKTYFASESEDTEELWHT